MQKKRKEMESVKIAPLNQLFPLSLEIKFKNRRIESNPNLLLNNNNLYSLDW